MRLEYFQLIDQVTALDADAASIVTRAVIPEHSTIFEGHFPGHPLMPGVLLIEAMAQASGFLLLSLNGFARMPYLASVKQAKLRAFVTPGSELEVTAKRIHDGSGYAVLDTAVHTGGKKACDAQLSFRIVAYPAEILHEHMLEKAAAVGLVKAGDIYVVKEEG